jgi:ATP-binding cassette subfamily B protein
VQPVRSFAGFLTQAQNARAGAERIFDLLDSNPLVTEAPDAVELEQPSGGIRFDNVTFGYLRSKPILQDFSLEIAPGETVAFVGTSGSGKSTLSLLLPRFYDVQGGTVSIDGHDVRTLTLDSLRRSVGVVFEETFLFSDSVKANIAFGRPEATDADIEAAARAAEAHAFISELPDDYDTTVGERGYTLSGGQRQRIALARALMRRPRLLVLDEPTNHLDQAAIARFMSNLRALPAAPAILIISHSHEVIAEADEVYVLKDRRLVRQPGAVVPNPSLARQDVYGTD